MRVGCDSCILSSSKYALFRGDNIQSDITIQPENDFKILDSDHGFRIRVGCLWFKKKFVIGFGSPNMIQFFVKFELSDKFRIDWVKFGLARKTNA